MGFSTGAVAINRYIANYRRNEIDEIDFKAAVALYGVCRSVYGYDSDSVPLMAIVGEKDVRLAPDCIAAGKQIPGLEVHVFPGAYHAFDSRGASEKIDSAGNKMRYSKSATNKARQLTKEFFAKHLGI